MHVSYSCKLLVCDWLKRRLKMARRRFYRCHRERDPLGPQTRVLALCPGDWVTGSKYEASSAFTFSEGTRLSSAIPRGFSGHLVNQFVKGEHGKAVQHELHMSYCYSYCQESAGTGTTSWLPGSPVTQSFPSPCAPTDWSPPGSSVHWIFQAGILEWVAISFSRDPSWPRARTCNSCTGRVPY